MGNTGLTLLPPPERRVPHHTPSNGEGGWALWRPQGTRRQERRPSGRRLFRDPRRSGEHGRPWRIRELGRPWRIRGFRRPWRDRLRGALLGALWKSGLSIAAGGRRENKKLFRKLKGAAYFCLVRCSVTILWSTETRKRGEVQFQTLFNEITHREHIQRRRHGVT